ncbi:SulP family inorganic anion transporter [Kitasatospora aburaviensis]
MSGTVTALFSIPEGMAYAAIGGFNPVAGLYAGVVPPILGSLTTPTVLMITTLTSAIALTGQSVLADAGLDPHDAGNVAALTVLVGLLMLLMGALRLGVLLSFVSNAVMVGFSTGIALQIITGVFKDATGYRPLGHNKLTRLTDWLLHAPDWQLSATLVAAATIAVWALAHAVRRLRPVALLVAMVVVSAAVAALGTDVELVRDIAEIPAALPGFSAPAWDALPHLAPGALSVALVALAQAAGISPRCPTPTAADPASTATSSPRASPTSAAASSRPCPPAAPLAHRRGGSAGARSRWAGVVSGVFLALVVLVAGSLAERIPMPVIGGLILVVGCELIWGKRADILLVVRTSRLSTLAMAATFVATTQLPLQQAIILGAVFSLLLYCVQAARRAHFTALTRRARALVHRARPRTAAARGGHRPGLRGHQLLRRTPALRTDLPDVTGARNAVLVLVVRTAPDIRPPPSSRPSAATRTTSTARAGASSSPASSRRSPPCCAAPASPTTSAPTPSPRRRPCSHRSTAPTPRPASGSRNGDGQPAGVSGWRRGVPVGLLP